MALLVVIIVMPNNYRVLEHRERALPTPQSLCAHLRSLARKRKPPPRRALEEGDHKHAALLVKKLEEQGYELKDIAAKLASSDTKYRGCRYTVLAPTAEDVADLLKSTGVKKNFNGRAARRALGPRREVVRKARKAAAERDRMRELRSRRQQYFEEGVWA